MSHLPGIPSKLRSKEGAISLGLVALLLGFAIWGILSNAFRGAHAGNTSRTSTTTLPLNPPVSPLLFGTNMGLFDNNDQVLTSAATRSLLQRIHAQIIRMPVRSGLSEATEIAAAQVIKSVGALPLVVLRGAVDSNVLADDSRIVNDMNRIFGNNLVYYEYGNEEDLLGVGANGYTASWNAVIPQLKRIALHGQFVGPVNFHYDRAYLTTFLQHASPRPDEVSWHEYTCDDSWSSDICISHIANWTKHFNDARAAMTAAIGTTLPIMITEWNYAPNAVPNDGKNNNSTFMTTWTSTALQTLAANRIFAAMQYSCTNTAIPLISTSNTLTPQGTIFGHVYQQMIFGGQQPPPAPTTVAVQPTPQPGGGTPNPTETNAPTSYSSFSFEDGTTDGWGGHGGGTIAVQNSTTVAKDGKHSLQISLVDMGPGNFPFVSVGQSHLAGSPQAGQTISMYVYVPGNLNGLGAKVFVMDSQYHWFDPGALTQLKPGTWNRLTFTLSSGVNGPLRQLGIQFNNLSNAVMSTDVYIDAVNWT